jgi:hypothetical protein
MSKVQEHIGAQLTLEKEAPEFLEVVMPVIELVGLTGELVKSPANAVFARVVLSDFRNRLSVLFGEMIDAVVGCDTLCVEGIDVEKVATCVAMFAYCGLKFACIPVGTATLYRKSWNAAGKEPLKSKVPLLSVYGQQRGSATTFSYDEKLDHTHLDTRN